MAETPNEKTNHIAWIVGHVIWARKQLLGRLGTEWSQPWLDLFARGAKCDDSAAYPSPDALMDALARGLRASWPARSKASPKRRSCAALYAGALRAPTAK